MSLESRIPLPDVKGRIDHLSVDVNGQRLFVPAVDNHTLEVIDLKSEKRIHTITNLAEPQGVFYDASTNRLFVACALDGVAKILDGTTFQVLATVKFPDDADNIRYDSHSRNVIVGYAGAKHLRKRETGSGGLGFLDTDGQKVSDIVIDAHPESFQIEKAGSRLFVNVPEKKEIEVVYAVKRSVMTRWPMVEENNFPMALDETHRRLFVACWEPSQLIVFDTQTGRKIAAGEIAGPSDDLLSFRFSGLGRSLNAGQMYCHATIPQTAKPNVTLIPNKTADGMIRPFGRWLSSRMAASNSLFSFTSQSWTRLATLSRGESLSSTKTAPVVHVCRTST